MEKIDRELLIKEISTRLPYKVKVQVFGWNEKKEEVAIPLKVYSINTDGYISLEYNHYDVETIYVEDCRLYLRSMSSMTEEEKLHIELKFHFSYRDGVLDNVHIFEAGGIYDRDGNYEPPTTYREIRELNMNLILDFIHWLNKKMFDYRKDDEGKTMIEKGLAIEAPEDMYN